MDDRFEKAKQLHEELKKQFDEIYNILEKVLKAYLRGMEEKEPTTELYCFFVQEIEKICNQNEDMELFDFAFALQLTEDKRNFTKSALELQEQLKPAYKKALERVRNNESVEEGQISSFFKHTISAKVLESMSKKAERYIFPNDKIANSLEKMNIDSTEYPLSEEKRGAANEVTTYISFDFDEAAKETDLSDFTLTFSEFDKLVQDAVVSLMKAGNKIITAEQIHKTLTGNNPKVRITPNWRKDINISMRKFNSVFVKANILEAIKLYPGLKKLVKLYPELKSLEKVEKGTRLMQFEYTLVECKNGSEVMAYEMLKEPILYLIADAKGLVGCFDMKLLENGKTTNSIDNTELKIYLLKRINAMSHKMSNSILFETLYNALNRTTQKEKRTTRENAEKLLLQFVADKIIEAFKIENRGRIPNKILITLNKEIHTSGK